MEPLPEAVIQDAERLAEKVADLGSADGIDAVVTVLREHVKSLDRKRRLTALNAISDEFQATIILRPATSQEAQEELYDEYGLPK